uniref:Pre-mRNA splicing Prp18-interacting factor n=1 Tax=Tanacetum cinerariifolium TaxID=118510 RepID=A0A6L2PBS3_TANCI|nr:hypothetical protein [Tanacetum cinerariifolium]
MSLFHQRQCHGCGQPCDGYYCESCTCPQCEMTLFNGICNNCIYGAGKPIVCTACGGINYDDNYYPHESPSFPCYDYCGESHETSQCQPVDQNIDFSSSNQIQTPQYPDVNPPSPEISNEENFQAKGDLMKSIQTFLERFNCIPFKLLKDLKELAEYDQSTSTDRPIFLNDNEDHPVQNKESPENSFEETVKQNMENTVLKLVDICHKKQLLCMHGNVEDIIKSALDTKHLSINSKSQHPNETDQEVKNVEEQPDERRNRAEKSLQNFRVIHKSSIPLNSSQISSVHEVAPILSTKEPEHLLSMGYEHLSITPETESDEVIESNAENLLPIPSELEVALEAKKECDLPISENSPVCDNHSDINDDILVYDDDFEDIEYVEASLSDPENVSIEEENSVEEENVVQQEEGVNFEDISQIQDVVLREKLLSIIHLISNIESLNDNSTLDRVLNSFESDNSLLDNFSPEFETFCDHSEETGSEEVGLFLSDNSIPPGIENVADDPEGDIHFLEELIINDSNLSHELSDSNFEDYLSIPRPPPEPPDVEIDAGEEIPVMMNDKDEDVDYSYSMFVIFDKMFSLLSAESEDIFDPDISD